MYIYAFANPKGGVGKTTVVLAIAAALVRRGVRPLLIDLDLQASATKVLGVDTSEQCTVADAMLEPERYFLVDAIVKTGLPAEPRGSHAERSRHT
jgi:chromosome partitioning protein